MPQLPAMLPQKWPATDHVSIGTSALAFVPRGYDRVPAWLGYQSNDVHEHVRLQLR